MIHDGVARLTGVGVLLFVVGVVRGVDPGWPQWGGPSRDFRVSVSGLADKWPAEGPKKLWSRPLGPGYSSIVAADGVLYTVYRDGDNDVIVALNDKDGSTKWEYRSASPTIDGQVLDFGTGPNSTPLIVDDRIVTISFSAKVNCLSRADGKLLWSRDLVKELDGKAPEFGYSASPVLYDGKIIVLVGGKKHGVAALSPKDGSLVWGGEPLDTSYASPKIIRVDGVDQIVFFGSDEVYGVKAADGSLMWRHGVTNQFHNNATDAIWLGDNRLWIATQLEGGARVIKLVPRDGKTVTEEEWFNKDAPVFHWNSIFRDGYVYTSVGSQVTFFAAVDARTGDVKWKEREFHKALCVAADGKIVFLDENGKLALVRVSPEKFELLSEFQLTEKPSWTAPTLVGTKAFVRDGKIICALELGKQ